MEVPTHFGKTLVLRGFAEGVSWKHIQNSSSQAEKNIVKDITKYIVENNFDTIVWDGDLYKSDPFTHIIYEVMKEKPSIYFVAFKTNANKFWNGDSKNCEIGWNSLSFERQPFITEDENVHWMETKPFIYLLPITMVDEDATWFDRHTHLIHEVFQTVCVKSSSFSVLYIGGGKIVEHEMKNILTYIAPIHLDFNILFLDIPRSSFSMCKTTGHPKCMIQYLGNNTSSIDPLTILPSLFKLKEQYKKIKLSFSKTQYLSSYVLGNY
jgi:hypothetical protein